MAGVTALCHLKRKPLIPMSPWQKAWHCYSSSRGNRTCMSPHETRHESPVETPEEPRDPVWPWRGNLKFWPELQMRTSAPAVTAEESLEALHNSHGHWTFLRPQERVPEVPIVTWEELQVSCRNSKKKTGDSPLNTRWVPLWLWCFKRNHTFPTQAQKVPWHPWGNSRSFPTYPSPHERNTMHPATTQEEPRVSLSSPDVGPFPCFIRKGIWAFPSHLKRRRSQLDTGQECQGSCHHSKRPRLPGASMGGPTLDRVMWRDLKGQGESGLKGSSSWASTLKPKSVCLLSAILYCSDITGGYPQPPFSGKY